uniref:RNA polymerase II subunit A C-terminal domain phosphatase SSU72 n=2 Tax=Cyprininae TaxID=2743694 RepID=A0A8C1P7I5_CYPCA
MPAHPLRVAVVCSSNQNRSMEAHNILSKRGFDVRSFGTGTHVKLPGPAPDKPNIYDFKTTYEQMYNDLVRKDKELYPQHTHTHTRVHLFYILTGFFYHSGFAGWLITHFSVV